MVRFDRGQFCPRSRCGSLKPHESKRRLWSLFPLKAHRRQTKYNAKIVCVGFCIRRDRRASVSDSSDISNLDDYRMSPLKCDDFQPKPVIFLKGLQAPGRPFHMNNGQMIELRSQVSDVWAKFERGIDEEQLYALCYTISQDDQHCQLSDYVPDSVDSQASKTAS